ncbi:hypothetical protein ASC63_00520 [Leifsonia sp. Root112D2]|nr:hypothetical protein ASC63_00520 [Leifsonia sp. Root112D2]
MVAILGVVAIHVFGGIVSNQDIRGSVTWWAAAAADLGNVWVVPAFVMVSGALLLGPRTVELGPSAFYRKRLLRLGPAFVGWQLFYLLVVRVGMSHQQLGVGGMLQLIVDGKTYTHLYFLWLIVGLYAVAPILAAFLNQGGQRRAVIFAVAVLVATLLVYSLAGLSALHGSPRPIVLSALTQWVPYVGYFLIGWALRNVVLSRLWTVIVAAVTALLLVEIVWQYGIAPRAATLQAIAPVSYIGAVVALATIGIFLVTQGWMSRIVLSDRAARRLKTLSAASFGTFLIHFFFLILAEVLFPGIVAPLSTSFWTALLVWAGVAIVSFAVSMVALRIPYLRRFF